MAHTPHTPKHTYWSIVYFFKDVIHLCIHSMNLFIYLVFLFFFLGPHPWHMEVPRLGVWIRAVATGLHQSLSNLRSGPSLQPTSQLTAMPDPLTHWERPGIEPESSWILIRFFFFFFLAFCLLRAAPAAYGGSQASSLNAAVADSLPQSHSNTRSELHLRLTAMPDP